MSEIDDVEDIYPLSPVQKGMLFHTLAENRPGVYRQQLVYKFVGDLDVERFEFAWNTVVDRHPALRAAFLWEGLDDPVQVVRSNLNVSLEIVERPVGVDLKSYLEADLQREFDLAAAPCMRLVLLKSDEGFDFLWSLHHIMLDGWSTAVVIREVFALYSGVSIGKAPEPYRNYLAWLQSQDEGTAKNYWREYLGGYRERVRLPIVRASRGTGRHCQIVKRLSLRHSRELEARGRQYRVSLNTMLMGSWAIVLSRYAERQDLVFGATVSGRNAKVSGISGMIGNFINTLPFRVRMDEEQALGRWLQDLQKRQIEWMEQESVPLYFIKDWSETKAGEDLFESIFVFVNYPREDLKLEGVTVSPVLHHEHSNYPLAALVVPGERMELMIIHDDGCYERSDVEALLEHWEHVVLQMTKMESRRSLRDLELVTERERERMLGEWNGSTVDFEAVDGVLELFSRQVAAVPDQPAVTLGNERLSYLGLDRESNRMANHLVSRGLKTGDRVVVYALRRMETVAAILGILKAGGSYVPVDPTYPKERMDLIMEDCGAAFCVMSDERDHTVACEVVRCGDRDLRDASPEFVSIAQRDLSAYLIYTSGSTGRPRGVVVSHASLLASTQARLHYYREPVEAFLLLSGFAFDSSVAGLFWTLVSGGCLCLLPEDVRMDPGQVCETVRRNRVTHTLGIPSLVDALFQNHSRESLQSLKTIIVAGEACPDALPVRLKNLLPEATVYNEYGPTETTVWATVEECVDQPVGIGCPIANTKVYVVGPRGNLVPPGVPGELYIGGPGVAVGYHNEKELSARKFVANTIDPEGPPVIYRSGDRVCWTRSGTLRYLGRMDDQIKLHGHRIEPGEIERALVSCPGVREATVALDDESRHPASVEFLEQALNQMESSEAEALLKEVSPHFGLSHQKKLIRGKLSVLLETCDGFIAPPRQSQRDWLVAQALSEFADDLEYLDLVSRRFVPGAGERLARYDIAESRLSDDRIMEEWQEPLMKIMARQVAGPGKDLLEIGFGRGVSATMIQDIGVRSHTIVESNAFSVREHFESWRVRYPDREIRMVEGRWQDVRDQLDVYDGIFFHAFPLNEQEFIDHVVESATFAEHFFPEAARMLREGGAFTYLTTEIDSLSRRHQRALLKYFLSIHLSVEKISPPTDTRDTWWADSMVIVKAVK